MRLVSRRPSRADPRSTRLSVQVAWTAVVSLLAESVIAGIWAPAVPFWLGVVLILTLVMNLVQARAVAHLARLVSRALPTGKEGGPRS